jgi:hypothetical protein
MYLPITNLALVNNLFLYVRAANPPSGYPLPTHPPPLAEWH